MGNNPKYWIAQVPEIWYLGFVCLTPTVVRMHNEKATGMFYALFICVFDWARRSLRSRQNHALRTENAVRRHLDGRASVAFAIGVQYRENRAKEGQALKLAADASAALANATSAMENLVEAIKRMERPDPSPPFSKRTRPRKSLGSWRKSLRALNVIVRDPQNSLKSSGALNPVLINSSARGKRAGLR